MSATEQRSQPEDNENGQEESSNLDYLGQRPAVDDVSRESNFDTNKKKNREWAEKESGVKRVVINNRQKDKKVENDGAF